MFLRYYKTNTKNLVRRNLLVSAIFCELHILSGFKNTKMATKMLGLNVIFQTATRQSGHSPSVQSRAGPYCTAHRHGPAALPLPHRLITTRWAKPSRLSLAQNLFSTVGPVRVRKGAEQMVCKISYLKFCLHKYEVFPPLFQVSPIPCLFSLPG